jgi:hypothetical protein
MNPDKTHTYNPKDFKWTMDDIVTEKYTYTPGAMSWEKADPDASSLPASDLPIEVKPLAFFWWLNPWKHMELLFDAYKHHAEVANEWRDRYHLKEKLWKADAAERDEATECIRDELDTTKAERDAANQAVRFLRNQRKKPSRK